MHLGIILVNNQLDAHFLFIYVYFYSLHVSGSHVSIIRRINCINTSCISHSVQMTVWCPGLDESHPNLHINPLNPKLNPICCLLALLGAYHFLHVSRIRVKLLTFRRLMSYIHEAPILDVSRSHTTTQHSR